MPGWDYAPQAYSRVSNIDFVIWILVGPYKYYMQNCQRTVKFYPIWGLSQRNCSGLQLTLVPGWDSAPHPLSRVSNVNFVILIFLGRAMNIPWKIAKGRQSFSHLGFRSNVLYEPLTDLSFLVGFCTSSPQQGVKYQLWYLDFFGGNPIYIPWKNAKGRKSSFPLGL